MNKRVPSPHPAPPLRAPCVGEPGPGRGCRNRTLEEAVQLRRRPCAARDLGLLRAGGGPDPRRTRRGTAARARASRAARSAASRRGGDVLPPALAEHEASHPGGARPRHRAVLRRDCGRALGHAPDEDQAERARSEPEYRDHRRAERARPVDQTEVRMVAVPEAWSPCQPKRPASPGDRHKRTSSVSTVECASAAASAIRARRPGCRRRSHAETACHDSVTARDVAAANESHAATMKPSVANALVMTLPRSSGGALARAPRPRPGSRRPSARRSRRTSRRGAEDRPQEPGRSALPGPRPATPNGRDAPDLAPLGELLAGEAFEGRLDRIAGESARLAHRRVHGRHVGRSRVPNPFQDRDLEPAGARQAASSCRVPSQASSGNSASPSARVWVESCRW